MNNTLFPVFLKTETARFLIVGGGNVGLEKTQTLLRQNPDVSITIVSISILPELKKVVTQHPKVKYQAKNFEESDVINADFVIAATNDKELNTAIKTCANSRNILVNAADQPQLCDFYLGSIVNKGSLKIAISTNGKSPVLARRMREHLEEAIPEDINDSIDSLNAFRNSHKGSFQEKLADLNRITQNLSATSPAYINKLNYRYLGLEVLVMLIVFVAGYGLSTVLSFTALLGYVQNIPIGFK
ncbi:bifunctional precorrin-2 dehydrogenase/sirohydrochlorin ferrochelatase [Flavobacterium zepuense]|uniref:precorrin-2 dehydrogenase n=1 Tax=Flavobacterium zepuense TaxID=2593302 RepID=A0A552V620_9FLAO|nr:bifunctional precorrin-2 dehydrogenase/sirohydrochlorin ferrochelatase [Flavobacterium zepuense]TRW25924.1 bifunctional precorrin-2 dehydrogenase/sirohydrochlorin ferrochelatase [Flavobacterium zepuense]